MEQNYLFIAAILLPVLAGIGMLTIPVFAKNRKAILATAGFVLSIHLIVIVILITGENSSFLLLQLTDKFSIGFQTDGVSRLFGGLTSIIWLLAGIYGFGYMKHEERESAYFGFYLIVLGILTGLDFSSNLITMYIFYELMTFSSFPLIMHTGTHEAVMAGLKYLFYSIAGAFLALFGIVFLFTYTNSLQFQAGGTLNVPVGQEGILLVAVMCTLIGFGAKAGLFPLHSWLPTAHPVAPAPASAVFSGIVTKSGVLAVIRVVYFIVGTEFIRGTWVQYTWLSLILLTILMGSMMAYKERGLKKRLAYSTVSQVSYMLLGLALLSPKGMMSGMSHIVYHSLIKNALFMVAGVIIVQTGRTRVEQLRGIGKEMPVTMWCYTIISLALIGIPPASGYISKYWLMQSSLEAGTGFFALAGCIVLLMSALLTAGYLLPITIAGFFPGEDYAYQELEKKEPGFCMLIPIVILTVATVILGVCGASPDSGGLMGFLAKTAGNAFR